MKIYTPVIHFDFIAPLPRLKAVSLNGDGGWTTRQKVKVDSNATVTWIILTVALLLVLVAAAMSFFVFRDDVTKKLY